MMLPAIKCNILVLYVIIISITLSPVQSFLKKFSFAYYLQLKQILNRTNPAHTPTTATLGQQDQQQ